MEDLVAAADPSRFVGRAPQQVDDFLAEVVSAVVEAGATTVNIPDTVGYAVPEQYAACIAHLRKHVKGMDKAVLSVHCHNDLGLAVANSLAAVREGARQIECTINGIGERAGNGALEEIVMALRTRRDFFKLDTGIQTKRLYSTSRLISHVTGIAVHLASNSAARLLCCGSRCWITTKATPLPAGIARRNSLIASSPPADAPMPTIQGAPYPRPAGFFMAFLVFAVFAFFAAVAVPTA